ncbi:extracellular matrix protein 2-like [Ictidomys tridecemlineatus]
MKQAMPSLPTSCLLAQTAIACNNIKMKHVPALTDPSLTTFYLAENEIAKIPGHTFLGLPNLEWLALSKNKLDTQGLHPHAFKNLMWLKYLNLDRNSQSTVPAWPDSQQELQLNDNLLQGLQRSSFQGLSHLLTLEVEGNQLHDKDISPLAFQPLHSLLYVTESVLKGSHSLSMLVFNNNRLQEDQLAPRAWIDLPPQGLQCLMLHHSLIKCISGYMFAHMKPGLGFLHLSHNRLCADGVHGMSFHGLRASLAELLLDHNHLQTIPRGHLGLKGLQNSNLISSHLENNLIDQRRITPTAFSCSQASEHGPPAPAGEEGS